MKKLTLSAIISFVLYLLMLLSYPFALAYKKDVEYVSGLNFVNSIPYRWVLADGNRIVFLENISSIDLELSLINEDGSLINNTINTRKGFGYTVVFDERNNDIVVITWVNPWYEDVEGVEFNICRIGIDGVCDERKITSDVSGTTIGVFDYKDGVFLAGSLKDNSVSGILSSMFYLDEITGKVDVVSDSSGDEIISPIPGVFWRNGVVYQKGADVRYLSRGGSDSVIASVDSGVVMEFWGNEHSLVWFSKFWPNESYDDPIIYWYNAEQGVTQIEGSTPFLLGDGMLMARRNDGIFFSDYRKDACLLYSSDKVWSPVYFNGKMYWSEKHINYAYPIHAFFYMLGISDMAPRTEHSFVFSKKYVECSD